MSEIKDQNKVLVRRIYDDMWNKGDFKVAGDIFAQSEGVQRFMREFLKAFPDLHHTIEELIAEDDRIVARFSAQGTHTGPWKDYPPTGKSIHYTGVTIAQVKDGKIIRHHTWWDRMEVIEQIKGESKE